MSETSSVERRVRQWRRTAKLTAIAVVIGLVGGVSLGGFIDLLATLWIWSGGKPFAFGLGAAPVIAASVYPAIAKK